MAGRAGQVTCMSRDKDAKAEALRGRSEAEDRQGEWEAQGRQISMHLSLVC